MKQILVLAVLAVAIGGGLVAQTAGDLEKPVRIKAGGSFIDTGKEIGYSGPLVRDHDGDGLPDLLVSSFGGTIRFFKNVGTRQAPEFKEGKPLQADGKQLRIKNW